MFLCVISLPRRVYGSCTEARPRSLQSHLFFSRAVVVAGGQHMRKILGWEFERVTVAYPPATKHVLGAHSLVKTGHSLSFVLPLAVPAVPLPFLPPLQLFLGKEKHRSQRGLVMKAFTPAAIESYIPGEWPRVPPHFRCGWKCVPSPGGTGEGYVRGQGQRPRGSTAGGNPSPGGLLAQHVHARGWAVTGVLLAHAG